MCCCDDDSGSGDYGSGDTGGSDTSDQPTCYDRNNMEYAPNIICSNSDQSSPCCGLAGDGAQWICLTNGLCKNSSDLSSRYERGGCSSKTWDCPVACSNGNASRLLFSRDVANQDLMLTDDSASAAIYGCTTDSYCCPSSHEPDDTCCYSHNRTEFLKLGAAIPSDTSQSIATATLQSSFPITPTSGSFIGDEHFASTTGMQIGVGVGFGVPLGLGAVGGGLYVLRRRKKGSQDQEQGGEHNQGPGNNSCRNQNTRTSRTRQAKALYWKWMPPWGARPDTRQADHELPEIAEPPPTYTSLGFGRRVADHRD